MQITECRFGEMTLDGVRYDKDLVVHQGEVHPNWFRKAGHSLCLNDLAIILNDPPEVLVVGCGHLKILRIPDETRGALAERGIDLIGLSTPHAVRRFLELIAEGRRVSAAFHLSC